MTLRDANLTQIEADYLDEGRHIGHGVLSIDFYVPEHGEFMAAVNETGTDIYDEEGDIVIYFKWQQITDEAQLINLVNVYFHGYENGIGVGRMQKRLELKRVLETD